MKAISLTLGHSLYVAVEQKTYFLQRLTLSTQLLPTVCPHRGGPLHMGATTDDGQSVICPWHTNTYKICNLERKSLPTVRVKDRLWTVIGDTEQCVSLIKLSRYDAWQP